MCASPARSISHPLSRWVIAFLALNLLDAAQTAIGLRLGSAEINPLYRALLHLAPYALLIPLKMACACAAVAYVLLTKQWWPAWVARFELQVLSGLMVLDVLGNTVTLVIQTR